MSKFIIALIATTFTMTAFADNHAIHTPVNTPMVGSTTAVVAPTQAPKHHTKEMHAKKAKYHTKKAKYHAEKAQHHRNVSPQKAVIATPVTN